MPHADASHLLIPYAAACAHEGQALWPAPAAADLPNLVALLRRMQAVDRIDTGAEGPSMPHELALAHLLGLPAEPGRVPWAAFETRTTGAPCGWLRPCHLQVGADQVLLAPPGQLALDEADSRALLDAAAPFFAEDGITLRYVSPDAWLATGEPLRGLPTWSMDRLAGRHLMPEVLHFTGHPHAARWQRLHNEMQMLFYAHRVNDERAQRRQPLVNALWVTGAGVLDALPAPAPHVAVDSRLRDSALALDAHAYAQAWRALDADSIATLLVRLRAGEAVHLTLAGERRAITYACAPTGLGARLTRLFAARPSLAVLDTL
ncbi:MAG TPA: phosphoglycerate mutase [Comamonadaceae bacterium]|nr:phosphoglycerate mutase [Comamonadaceae bacterium]